MSFSFPLSSLPLSQDRVRMEALLKPGSRHSAKVTAALADGRVRLFFAGQSLLLRPEKPLATGSLVELRVHAGPKGAILEIVPEGTKGLEGKAQERIQNPVFHSAPSSPLSGSQTGGSLHRLFKLLSDLAPSGLSGSGSGARSGMALMPFLSLAAEPEDNLPLLRGLVRAFLQEPSREGFNQFRGEGTLLPKEGDPHPSLALLVKEEGGKEGLDLLQEFRENLARTFLDQGRMTLPLPLGLDGFFSLGRLFLDLGDPGGGSRESRILRAGIRLDLETLGRVRADALLLGKELQLGFAAEEAGVLALFEEGMPELVRRLEGLGFRVLPVRYEIFREGAWEEEGADTNSKGDWEVIA
ncbi:flagellar hook-length control protein FliK [Desulfobotulus sp.]|uniref:flagellar hook-length control protein FliK n=1 Tax=Desulfobotulus sp. TaxID=1940337 RepID=UPI002A36828D|nr:flagellar hook-length control protein FliK [Desulfobotulus sp.]MDY0164654.1 flagellar hook-length control protein FliK [Desulfobotulus sp.]